MAEKADDGLAAALLFKIGEAVPHDAARDEEADAVIKQNHSDSGVLMKIISLCGNMENPKRLYICAKAYSRLGKKYAADAVKVLKAYLISPGWDELPSGIRTENGVAADITTRIYDDLYMELGTAYAGTGNLEKALSTYRKAHDLEPYRIICIIEVSNTLFCLGRYKEAMDFLLGQRDSLYYRPKKYRDENGNVQVDRSFQEALNRQTEIMKKRVEGMD